MEERRRKGQGSNIIIIFKLIASVSSVGIVGVVVIIIYFSLTSFILGVIKLGTQKLWCINMICAKLYIYLFFKYYRLRVESEASLDNSNKKNVSWSKASELSVCLGKKKV